MDISENGFQTPGSKERKASDLPSLPLASQPSMPPFSCKNRTPLIATAQKIQHSNKDHERTEAVPSKPQSFQNQAANGWIFVAETPKDFAILQSAPKEQQVFGENVKGCHYQGLTILQTPQNEKFWFLRKYLAMLHQMISKNCLIITKLPTPRLTE